MTLVIGTDEAGYGPNLGPLVVAASAWRMKVEPDGAEHHLASAVEAAAPGLWGDSKKIYRAGAGFDALERGTLVAMTMSSGGTLPTEWRALPAEQRREPPEVECLGKLLLPRHAHEPEIDERSRAVARLLASAEVSLLAIRARVIQPSEFNALLATGLNKSDILSQATLDLAATLAAHAAADEPRLIWCDRHGGRRRYAPLVARAFGIPLVRPLEETATRSAYELPPRDRIEFTVSGEARVPVAVASMTAKYLRELAMLAFNAFWTARMPGLVETAGYPVDAARWRHDAACAVEASRIPIDSIWRWS